MEIIYAGISLIVGFGFLLYLALGGYWSEFTPAERKVNKWILTVIIILFFVALLFERV